MELCTTVFYSLDFCRLLRLSCSGHACSRYFVIMLSIGRPRSAFGLISLTIRSVAMGNQGSRPKLNSRILWFHRSAPLVPRSNWSDRRTESESGSGPWQGHSSAWPVPNLVNPRVYYRHCVWFRRQTDILTKQSTMINPGPNQARIDWGFTLFKTNEVYTGVFVLIRNSGTRAAYWIGPQTIINSSNSFVTWCYISKTQYANRLSEN